MLYKAEYTDFSTEWIFSSTDDEAIEESEKYGDLLNVFEVDEDLNIARDVY